MVKCFRFGVLDFDSGRRLQRWKVMGKNTHRKRILTPFSSISQMCRFKILHLQKVLFFDVSFFFWSYVYNETIFANKMLQYIMLLFYWHFASFTIHWKVDQLVSRTYAGSETTPFGLSPAAFQFGYMTLALLFGNVAWMSGFPYANSLTAFDQMFGECSWCFWLF